MTEDEKSVAELCKPLSAKVMPRRFRFSTTGNELSDDEQLRAQRKSVEVTQQRKKGRRPA